MKTPVLFFIISFLLRVPFLFARQEGLKEIVSSFESYSRNNPVEKLYLHLDKPYYAAGEYIYIRAYLTDIHLNENAVASNIIYVELSDEKNSW